MQSTRGVFIFLTLPLSVICLGAGFCAGRFLAPNEVVVNTTEVMTANRVIDVSSEDAQRLSRALDENERLRRQLASLDLHMDENQMELPVDAGNQRPEGAPPQAFRSFREAEEELKERDPEAYQRMVEMRARFIEMRRNERESRLGFLESVDVNLLTAEEQSTHAAYLNAVQRQAELEEHFIANRENGVEPTEEEMNAMREANQAIRDLREEENIALLSAVGTVWNIPEEELSEFVKSIETVNQVLSGNSMRGRGGRGGPMGGPTGIPMGGPGGGGRPQR